MNVPVFIDTEDRGLAHHLLGSSVAQIGDEIHVSDDITVTYQGTIERKALGFPETIELVIYIASTVAVGVAANWIYDKLKGKNITRLQIKNKVVEFDEGEIKRIIEETIEIDNE